MRYEDWIKTPFVETLLDHTFVERLMRENAWSIFKAERTVREYQRFLWIAHTSKVEATPSDAVDQVWHLHLIDTVGYQEFCKEALGRLLEHRPSRGGLSEQQRFTRQYSETLVFYEREFGKPAPADIWPPVDQRFAQFVRVNVEQHWVIVRPSLMRGFLDDFLLFQPPLTALYLAIFLFSLTTEMVLGTRLPGLRFLVFDVAIWLCCLCAVLMLSAEEQKVFDGEAEAELDAYHVAELADPGRSFDCVVALLLTTPGVGFDSESKTFILASDTPPTLDHPFELRLWEAIYRLPGAKVEEILEAVQSERQTMVNRLQAMGLLETPSSSRSWRFWMMFVTPWLGCVRWVSSWGNGRPVGWLVVLTLVQCVIAIVWFRVGSGRTSRGEMCLKRLLAQNEYLGTAKNVSDAALIPLSFALFGTGAAMAQETSGLLAYLDVVHPPTPSSNSEGGGCGGGGGGGGGCGGGGGGGGGGGSGCGGCGGCGG